jgi:hypothetical protein
MDCLHDSIVTAKDSIASAKKVCDSAVTLEFFDGQNVYFFRSYTGFFCGYAVRTVGD